MLIGSFRILLIVSLLFSFVMMTSSSCNSNCNSNSKIVAVTGASGFIGSHVCQNLLQHGYTVRACVRSRTAAKTQHLLDMCCTGKLELHVADMGQPGAYDTIFPGCFAVCHVAGNFGTDPQWQQPPRQQQPQQQQQENQVRSISYEQGVYESYVRSMQYILDAVAKARTVKRFIYTSSQCTGPYISDAEHVYETFHDNPYGKGKEDCERMAYDFGEEHADDLRIICASSVPCEVLGPILASPTHDVVYPHRLADLMAGKWALSTQDDDDECWCVADVRDVADTQRRMIEYPHLVNGARFYNGADSNILCRTLIRQLQTEFSSQYRGPRLEPNDDSSSEEEEEEEEDSHASSYGESEWSTHGTSMWSNPETVLGLARTSVAQTIRDTVQSLLDKNIINRPLTTEELRNYYKVAEMDGEQAEMDYIVAELARRNESVE